MATNLLVNYAAGVSEVPSRNFPESTVSDRNEYQRDATRIIHADSFRQLQYKTQVFSNHEGGHFRTRATHSIEVAQISRSFARQLGLNQDLAEAIALAHDLGHAPFGHLGQTVLNERMSSHGGFEHNLQALRIVDQLEKPYLEFAGMNLLYDTREGILKHCSAENAKQLGKVGERFLFDPKLGAKGYRSPSLEAQLTDLCDAIAYTHADLEDAVTMGVLSLSEVEEGIPLFADSAKAARSKLGSISKSDEVRFVKHITSQMMKIALADLFTQSKANIDAAGLSTIQDVRESKRLIGFSNKFSNDHHIPMKKFLRQKVYTCESVAQFQDQQSHILNSLFDAFEQNPKKLVKGFSTKDSRSEMRQICDAIASLTDRQAVVLFQQVLPGIKHANSRTKKMK